ncbi:MAG: hypothetical protein Q8K24_15830 [Hydrogenophaga sp.]|nr:hypothetical protein [Hydrogenophaga sp.]
MASDFDTVRVLRALFNDMPRAPQGLSHGEMMAWIRESMADFEGGETAYMIEHITRNSMVDIVLRLREEGYLQDDLAFEETLKQIATVEGRVTFMDRCIQAQKTVEATRKLLSRAKRSWAEVRSPVRSQPDEIQRLVDGEPTGPGPLFAEYICREDVRAIGVFAGDRPDIYEFEWGFVTEEASTWNIYIAEVWRRGTLSFFEYFIDAWAAQTSTPPHGISWRVPEGLAVEVGIGAFSCITLRSEHNPADEATRQWLGDDFVAGLLPELTRRALDDNGDPPPKH